MKNSASWLTKPMKLATNCPLVVTNGIKPGAMPKVCAKLVSNASNVMTEIISVDSFYIDLVEEDGTTHWIAVAKIADMVETLAARYHPADFAHPAEYGPAMCSASFALELDDAPPPVDGTDHDKIQWLDNLDLDWQVDED